ncbi:MAG: UDP-N-acetylglucosamine 2-epimerase (non-hydrolyzing) [Nitrospinae bacterium]|nr:UDP-N-acetylglucosamine 2-epimerase (non-hydrolyzing) [Nitrospinota bacterium]
MKLVTVVGARPQFIKAAMISREIAKYPEIEEIIIHTGQHFDKNMSDIFFEEMKIPLPHYNLKINSMNHGAMMGKMLECIEDILLYEKPDFLMVYGDTNSTLAGALAAKKLHIGVIHVEAGLRSFNMRMPEEINRVLTDRISDILCCPTKKSVENLKNEGFENLQCQVVKTGDVMQDAAWFYQDISGMKSQIICQLTLENKNFILCTIHRAENTDDLSRLSSIISALNEIAKEVDIILPLHPRTVKILEKNNLQIEFRVIPPVGYFDMIELLRKTTLVLTDSGGLQKEAFFFAKPCVTLRDETEWTELVECGFNRLAGTEKNKIIESYREMRKVKLNFNVNLYGNGDAAKNIIETILSVSDKLKLK